MVAAVIGCSHTAGHSRSGDADSDRRVVVDAGVDVTSPMEVGWSDASNDATHIIIDAVAPTVTTLSISPRALDPPFSTAIHDYYVRCAAGTNALTVSMTAAPGSAIALVEPFATTASIDETTQVSVTEGEAIVVGVTTGGTTDRYWVRCLPHDFPKLQMTLHSDAGTPTPGYYLLGNVIAPPGQRGYAMVLDGHGVPVWYDTTKTGAGADDVDNLAPGTISFISGCNWTFASVSSQFELHDLSTGTTTYVESAGIPVDEHELRVLPNGDYLVIAAPIARGVDLTGLGSFGANENMTGCDIQEVDPTGAAVWQWTATDHFDPVQDSTFPQTAKVSGETSVEPFHCNSIDVSPDGDLLVSARGMDSVFLISRATGAVLWKMGGATYTKDGAPYLAVQNDPLISFYRQHDARFLPDGNISMFDDQSEKPGPARAVIYSYDVAAGTATMVWQYLGTASSGAMGSFRVMDDGSRVIGWGGPTMRALTELDANGNDVLDFYFPDGAQSYRAIKIPTTAFDINLLRSSAGAK